MAETNPTTDPRPQIRAFLNVKIATEEIVPADRPVLDHALQRIFALAAVNRLGVLCAGIAEIADHYGRPRLNLYGGSWPKADYVGCIGPDTYTMTRPLADNACSGNAWFILFGDGSSQRELCLLRANAVQPEPEA
jgi:hypothetical protein